LFVQGPTVPHYFYKYEKAQRNKVEAVNMPSTYTDKFIYCYSNTIPAGLQQLIQIALHHNAFLQTQLILPLSSVILFLCIDI